MPLGRDGLCFGGAGSPNDRRGQSARDVPRDIGAHTSKVVDTNNQSVVIDASPRGAIRTCSRHRTATQRKVAGTSCEKISAPGIEGINHISLPPIRIADLIAIYAPCVFCRNPPP
ncbi:hypothetical protein D3C87_1591950 [compost metagenome]